MQCVVCKHRTPGEETCLAYPLGIPAVVLTGQVSHEQPLPGDRGFQFESEEEFADAVSE